MQFRNGNIRLLVIFLLLAFVGVVPFWIAYSRDSDELAPIHEAIERADFSTASILLANYLKKQPDDAPAILLAAITARRSGNFARASDYTREFEQKNGPNEALSLERELIVLQQGDLSEADFLFSSCNQRSSAESALILEALIEGRLKVLVSEVLRERENRATVMAADVESTQRICEPVVEHTSWTSGSAAEGYVWQGKLHAISREYAKAESDFRQALEIDPDQFEARLLLAKLLMHETPKEATTHFEILLRRDPENNDVRFNLAAAFRSLGQLDEAAKSLDTLLATDPQNVTYLLERPSRPRQAATRGCRTLAAKRMDFGPQPRGTQPSTQSVSTDGRPLGRSKTLSRPLRRHPRKSAPGNRIMERRQSSSWEAIGLPSIPVAAGRPDRRHSRCHYQQRRSQANDVATQGDLAPCRSRSGRSSRLGHLQVLPAPHAPLDRPGDPLSEESPKNLVAAPRVS